MTAPRKPPSAPPVKTPKRPTPAGDIPLVIEAPTLDEHLEIMTRAVFQAGLSWAIIAARWPSFQAAFEGFDVRRVAAYGEFDLDRLMSTDGIVHSAKKISGTFANAKTFLELEAEYGDVPAYVASFASYAALSADARKRFAFLGDLSCYYWLFRTANTVPAFEEWIARQATDHPRMREMVTLARTQNRSPERAGF